MDEQELIQEISDYIKSLYKATYTGFLDVTKSYGIYTFVIGIPTPEMATTISYEGNDEDFLEFIKEEIRVKNYMRTYFYKVVRDEERGR